MGERPTIRRMADVRQHLFDTHAFDAQTLKYLDTAGEPFENIAPHEVGADFGWPYITPQRYLVVCSDDGEAPGIRFRLNEETGNRYQLAPTPTHVMPQLDRGIQSLTD
jgi:hypothetical protein